MKKLAIIGLVGFLCLGLLVGCGGSGVEDVKPVDNDKKVSAEMAEVKVMMVPMTKDPYSGIRDAVSEGMKADGAGYETNYVDQLSNGTTLKLNEKFRMLIILPANQTTPYHWTELVIEDDSVVALDWDEYVSDENPEMMMGVGGHRVYEILAKSPGETKVYTKQTHVGDDADVMEEFEMKVVVE
ncbi:MAG: protease inhibitor I42 family protein [Caldisericia bacterium]